MPVMTGKHALMEMLKAEGVKYVFGNPGTSESPIMDAIEDHPELEYVLVVQEGVAMGMADAYARATGKPSFVNLHIETGLGNSISLLHNAFDGGTSLVLSAGNKDIRELAQGRTDLAAMTRNMTKWSAEVTHPDAVPVMVRRAFNEAKTPPTAPSFVAFSANSLDGELDADIAASPVAYTRLRPDADAVEAAVRVLAGAENPVLIVGDRVSQSAAVPEAVRVAELLGARVYASSYSEVNFPSSHPQFGGSVRLGYSDILGLETPPDAVLMVGKMTDGYYMFSQPTLRYFSDETKLVHVDADGSGVGRTQPTEVGMVADPKTALADLAESLETGMPGSAREEARGRQVTLAAEKKARDEAWNSRVRERWDSSPLSAERMMAEIASALPDDTVICNDAVTSSTALHAAVPTDEPGKMYGGRGGALGWGMGGTLGLKLAYPNRPVVGVLGDGSAMMTIQGLWTAAARNIPVVYVICNNASYRVLKVNMDAYKSRIFNEEDPQSQYIGMDFDLPFNIAGIAESFGMHARRIEDPATLRPAMEEALALDKPALLDVVIDGSL